MPGLGCVAAEYKRFKAARVYEAQARICFEILGDMHARQSCRIMLCEFPLFCRLSSILPPRFVYLSDESLGAFKASFLSLMDSGSFNTSLPLRVQAD